VQIIPYIHFGGCCEEALNRYAEVFGGEVEGLMRWRDGPPEMQGDPSFGDKVMHGSVRFGQTRLMASDSPPDHYEVPKGVSISVDIDDIETARTAFNALRDDDGQVWMEFGPTFWSKGFGMLTDRFGAQWMISAGATETA